MKSWFGLISDMRDRLPKTRNLFFSEESEREGSTIQGMKSVLYVVADKISKGTPDVYADMNGNGVPDVFENRRSISEILNSETSAQWPSGSFTGSADYGKYRIHIPTEGNAVMLEIKNGESFVACVFRSDAEMHTFITHFAELRAAVFGDSPR